MADQSTIATTFLILSDTHNFQFHDTPERKPRLLLPTPPVDVLLHCGDLTEDGEICHLEKAVKMLGSMDAELKLVIAGNHDLELDQDLWVGQRSRFEKGEEGKYRERIEEHDGAVQAMTGPLADAAGVTYLTEGTHSFTLKSGATFTIYASPYTPGKGIFRCWAFGYPRNEDRFNDPNHVLDRVTSIAKHPIPDAVDIVMTHGPPQDILDRCNRGGNAGCRNLLQALRRVQPKLHCFGHIHEGHGMAILDWEREAAGGELTQKEEGLSWKRNPYPEHLSWENDGRNRTMAVNAAIMDRYGMLCNAPWIVKLDLPRSSPGV